MTIVNSCLAFVTESCFSNVSVVRDLVSGTALNDLDQGSDMTFSII